MDDLADNGSVSVSGRLLADAPMRASDADRHATVLILQDAMARGLLTADEGSDRMATAFAAVHVRDLSPLTADLPADAARRGGPPGWRVLLMMLFEQFSSLFRDNRTGRYSRRRIVVAVLLAVLLLGLLLGMSGADGIDGGPPRGAGGIGDR